MTAPKSDANVVSSSDIYPEDDRSKPPVQKQKKTVDKNEGLPSYDWLMAKSPQFRSIASQNEKSDKKVKPVIKNQRRKKNKKSPGFL